MCDLPAITPADLALLRASIKRPGGSDGTFALGTPPFLCRNRHDGLWELHAYGRLQATGENPSFLLAILAREFEQPGFIIYAMKSELDPETALLPPAVLSSKLSSLANMDEAREEAARAKEDAEWRTRRAKIISPAALTLDDLDD